jgi:hypothetical protein
MRVAPPIALTSEQREELEQCARARLLSVRLVERARIVLLAAAGKQDKDIAAELGSPPRRQPAGGSDSSLWGWWAWRRTRPGPVGRPASPPRR